MTIDYAYAVLILALLFGSMWSLRNPCSMWDRDC